MSLGISYPGYRHGFPGKIHYAMEDGTPFALITAAHGFTPTPEKIGPGTYWPVGFTLAETAELYWRVREFTMDHSLYFYTSELNGEGSAYGLLDKGLVIGVPTIINREVELIDQDFGGGTCYGELATGSGTWEMSDLSDSGDVEVYSLGSVFTQYNSPSGPHPLRFFDGKFWPYFYIEIAHSLLLAPIPDFHTASSAIVDDGAAVHQGDLITFFGKPVPIFTGGWITMSGIVTVEPSEWWKYGGKYDPATGNRL